MKKIILAIFGLLFFATMQAQQTAYYQSAFGLNGSQLKTALHNIIDAHSVQSWPLWNGFAVTDVRAGKIWDIYSDIPGGTPPYTFTVNTDACGQYSGEGDCYNHEHIWPKTYFNDALPMANDLHHVFPTDGWVNNKRGSLPFGETNASGYSSQNGSKVASSNSYSSYSGSVFEPIDSFKGDVARVIFYTSTRYQGEDASWSNWPMANKAELTSDAITLLLQWHLDDPVSQKERNRNDAVQSIQGNRNPFIDYPEFAQCIWGGGNCTSLSLKQYREVPMVLFPNPTKDVLTIKYGEANNVQSIKIYNQLGVLMLETKNESMSTQDLAQGIYFIEALFDQGRATQIFLKK
jgi:endonuclease I